MYLCTAQVFSFPFCFCSPSFVHSLDIFSVGMHRLQNSGSIPIPMFKIIIWPIADVLVYFVFAVIYFSFVQGKQRSSL